jgi:uncharacterized protein (TIGR04255 family)
MNWPIIEVACEIKFEDDFDDLMIYGKIQDKLRNKFVKSKLQSYQNIVLEKTDGRVEPKSIEFKLQQFLTDDEKTLVQVGSDVLTINKLKPYNKWEEFLPDIKTAYDAFIEATNLKKIKRIGLRYINKINFKEPLRNIEDYFSFRPEANNALGKRSGPLVAGMQFDRNNNADIMKITLASTEADPGFKDSFILDLDYFQVDSQEINASTILKWIDNAHAELDLAFSLCITNKLKESF